MAGRLPQPINCISSQATLLVLPAPEAVPVITIVPYTSALFKASYLSESASHKESPVSWAGPALGEDFGTLQAVDDIMQACFDDLTCGQGEGAGWRLPAPLATVATNIVAARAHNTRATGQYAIENATLWGGNLTVLASLVGTPYFPKPDTIKGGVLFIEDVGEHPYRVERFLTQLLHAGVLASQKAVIFGQFSNYKLVAGYDSGFNLKTVAARLQAHVKARVLMGLPFGHVPTKVLLPVGARVTLAVDEKEALIVWGDGV